MSSLINDRNEKLTDAELILVGRHSQRVRFYCKLSDFGYHLFLKPVKRYEQEDGTIKRKANCDVEMAFRLMREKDNFDRAIILSGDDDFLPVLKYLREIGKEVVVMARGLRTARRQFAGDKFIDFARLKHKLEYRERK